MLKIEEDFFFRNFLKPYVFLIKEQHFKNKKNLFLSQEFFFKSYFLKIFSGEKKVAHCVLVVETNKILF
jgi:hypothetical protein